MDFDGNEGCDDIAGLVCANIITQIHEKLKSIFGAELDQNRQLG
jgi:hypothetical protein